MCKASDQFHLEIENIRRRGQGSPKYAKLHFTLLRDHKGDAENNVDLKKMNLYFTYTYLPIL